MSDTVRRQLDRPLRKRRWGVINEDGDLVLDTFDTKEDALASALPHDEVVAIEIRELLDNTTNA